MRKVVLHIGAEKTGTTTLQNTFALNREALKVKGILYPTTFGQTNHIALTAYALSDDKLTDQVRYQSGVVKQTNLDDFRSELKRLALAEIDESDCNVVLLSNEHCSSRLRTFEEVERLRQLLASFSDEIKIVYYLRNPVDFLASWYSTSISGGSTLEFPSPVTPDLIRKVDYRSTVKIWESVFGFDSIALKIFDPLRFEGGSLVDDFLHAIGCENLQLKTIAPKNKSLHLNTLVFLREFNKHIPRLQDGEPNRYRGQILAALHRGGDGRRFMLSKKDADQVMSHFQKDFIYLANRYLKGAAPLFREPQLVAQECTDLPALSFDESVRIAALIWAFARQQTLGSAIHRRKNG